MSTLAAFDVPPLSSHPAFFPWRTLVVIPSEKLSRLQRRGVVVDLVVLAMFLSSLGWLTSLIDWLLGHPAHPLVGFGVVAFATISSTAVVYHLTSAWWTRPLNGEESRALLHRMQSFPEVQAFVDDVKSQRQVAVFDLWVVGAWLADEPEREGARARAALYGDVQPAERN